MKKICRKYEGIREYIMLSCTRAVRLGNITGICRGIWKIPGLSAGGGLQILGWGTSEKRHETCQKFSCPSANVVFTKRYLEIRIVDDSPHVVTHKKLLVVTNSKMNNNFGKIILYQQKYQDSQESGKSVTMLKIKLSSLPGPLKIPDSRRKCTPPFRWTFMAFTVDVMEQGRNLIKKSPCPLPPVVTQRSGSQMKRCYHPEEGVFILSSFP